MRTTSTSTATGGTAPGPLRVGFFGLLGSGNLGNDASFEAVLRHLQAHHPGIVVDALCMGPERLTADYGIPARRHLWYRRFEGRVGGLTAGLLKSVGKVVDAFQTASWVRRHDVVVVPGMGVLEVTLPLRASGMPYALFLLSASGRLFGTKVILLNVGASPINGRLVRWLSNATARLATYCSYRDQSSAQAMLQRGVDTWVDQVYPDLVFGLEAPEPGPGGQGVVGVGLMAFYGNNEDRHRSQQIYRDYVEAMQHLVRWLVETGHTVRLFSGDDVDEVVVRDVLRGWPGDRPVPNPSPVTRASVSSLRDLMREMANVDAVVATRYHNVLSALRLSKPTIAIGYSAKHDALMSDMGMPPEFSHSARAIDVEGVIEQFGQLERRAKELRQILVARNREQAGKIAAQLSALSERLFTLPPAGPASPGGGAPASARRWARERARPAWTTGK